MSDNNKFDYQWTKQDQKSLFSAQLTSRKFSIELQILWMLYVDAYRINPVYQKLESKGK